MEHYFLNINGTQSGPFTLDEIKSKKILSDTPIWKTGMSEWSTAENLEELKPYVVSSPPPLRKPTPSTISQPIQRKYDNSYDKDLFAAFIGVIVLLIFVLIQLEVIAIKEESRNIYLIFSTLIRIALTIWIIAIAGEQNRNKVGWGIFGFFLPPLALIIIGFTPKIKKTSSFEFENSSISNNSKTSSHNDNGSTLAEWRANNPKKSLNDYYAELKKNKK